MFLAGFRAMPERLRHRPELPPVAMMRRAWSVATSRALWGGTAWSGSGFHYHNPAYNVLFFGTKEWMITPPRCAPLSPSPPQPLARPCPTSGRWLRSARSALARSFAASISSNLT